MSRVFGEHFLRRVAKCARGVKHQRIPLNCPETQTILAYSMNPVPYTNAPKYVTYLVIIWSPVNCFGGFCTVGLLRLKILTIRY